MPASVHSAASAHGIPQHSSGLFGAVRAAPKGWPRR
jgi:hypothetical protein